MDTNLSELLEAVNDAIFKTEDASGEIRDSDNDDDDMRRIDAGIVSVRSELHAIASTIEAVARREGVEV